MPRQKCCTELICPSLASTLPERSPVGSFTIIIPGGGGAWVGGCVGACPGGARPLCRPPPRAEFGPAGKGGRPAGGGPPFFFLGCPPPLGINFPHPLLPPPHGGENFKEPPLLF